MFLFVLEFVTLLVFVFLFSLVVSCLGCGCLSPCFLFVAVLVCVGVCLRV